MTNPEPNRQESIQDRPPCGICAEPLHPEADLIGPPHDRGWPTLNRQPVHLECRRLYVMGEIPAERSGDGE